MPPRTALPRFEEVFASQRDSVYALARRLTDSADSAEDVMQEAFVAAWEGYGRFRGESTITTWLHRIVVRSASRRVRKLEATELREQSTVSDASNAVAGLPDPLDRMALEDAIQRLPTGARTVLVLHEIHGYGHDEIARMLDVSPGTSKSQLHRARRLLFESLHR